jgi:uncharacterized protein YjgD (DUF1641 family)
MGKPITTIANKESTQEHVKIQKLDRLVEDLSKHADGLQKSMELLHELHENGVLEIALSLLKAKEKVAKIAIDQMVRPPVTNMINNAMAAAGAISELEPETTKKLLKSFSNGMAKAEKAIINNEKVGVFDLVKTLRDPDINRILVFGLNLLKGMGEGLKEQ